jgi:hypothetical protein
MAGKTEAAAVTQEEVARVLELWVAAMIRPMAEEAARQTGVLRRLFEVEELSPEAAAAYPPEFTGPVKVIAPGKETHDPESTK